MSALVSWEYYSSLHNKVTETDFDKSEALAEKEICTVIGPIRWANITSETFGYDSLKDCICNVMDIMADNNASGVGRGIVSVSNDGYTEQYATSKDDEVRKDVQKSIKTMLSGTGLVGAY